MPYDVVAFESDENALALSETEEGLFHRILRKAWINGSVPADLDQLANLCRTRPSTLKKAWPKLGAMWIESEENPKRLINKKQEKERIFRQGIVDANSAAGKLSAKLRKEKEIDSTSVQRAFNERSTSLPSPSLPIPIEKGNREGDMPKSAYGEFGHVRLSEMEHGKLTERLNGNLAPLIDRLDRWGEEEPAKFRKKKSHYATILNWATRDGVKPAKSVADRNAEILEAGRRIYGPEWTMPS